MRIGIARTLQYPLEQLRHRELVEQLARCVRPVFSTKDYIAVQAGNVAAGVGEVRQRQIQ